MTETEKRELQAFGHCVRACRIALKSRDAKWTLAYLAHESEIDSKGSMSQVEKGTRVLSTLLRRRIVHTLVGGLEQSALETDRREILKAWLCSFLERNSPPSPPPNVPRDDAFFIQEITFDLLGTIFDLWEEKLYAGDSLDVVEQAQDQYQRLAASSLVSRNLEVLVLASRVALWLANAQQLAFDFRQETPLTTLNIVERELFQPVRAMYEGNPVYSLEYARLLAARGTLYRVFGRHQQAIADAHASVDFAKKAEDEIFYIHASLELAHEYAILGLPTEWSQIFERIEAEIVNMTQASAQDLEAFVAYYKGEGMKRLAYNHFEELSWVHREALAGVGEKCLSFALQNLGDRWRNLAISRGITGFYPLNTRVGIAQCQMWTTEQAKKMHDIFALLREEAVRDAPALLRKIDFSCECLESLIRWHSHDTHPIFDLDTPTKPPQTDEHRIRGRIIDERKRQYALHYDTDDGAFSDSLDSQ